MTIANLKIRASVITAALFCFSLCLINTSCGDEGKTPTWSKSNDVGDTSALVQNSEDAVAVSKTGEVRIRLMAYNVENWLSLDAMARDRGYEAPDKSEKSKDAVIQLMIKHQPNVIGLSEIGTADDLADIQERLKKAGLVLPHSHYAGGTDLVRRLGVLSKFPIIETKKPEKLDFTINGKSYGMNRGILDTTLRVSGEKYRLLGVHLKSKREVRGVDQEAIRIHEAQLLREHVDSILRDQPNAQLIVYGDFNDTRPSKAYKAVVGTYGEENYLTAIPFKDSRGDAWTHHWAMHDIYSRIDYVMVSQSMRKKTDFEKSYIIDDTEWSEASDHRPLMAIFR